MAHSREIDRSNLYNNYSNIFEFCWFAGDLYITIVYNNKLIPCSFADDLVFVSNQKDSLSFVSLWSSDISIDVIEEDDFETEKGKKKYCRRQ